MPRLINAFEQLFASDSLSGGPYLALNYSSLSGSFTAAETITGGTSGATAVIQNDIAPQISCRTVSGEFQVGETITGGTSAATATLENFFLYDFPNGASPLANGKIDFFETGSSTVRKTTYSDPAETIPNSNPLIINGDGRVPNVYGTGSYRAVLSTATGIQIAVRDPIGGDVGDGFGDDWTATTTYGETDVVRDGGLYWQSLTNGNENNKPSTDNGTNWVKLELQKKTEIVETYAELDAIPAQSTGNIITVTGDGIVGDWVVDDGAHTANVGTIRDFANAVGNQYLRRLYSGAVNVGWFGSVGDGVVDDTAAWEACRDFCLTAVTTTTFAASDGTYYLPNGINLYGLLYTHVTGNIFADNETDEIIIGSNVVAANPSRYFFRNGNCTLKVEGMSRGHVEFLRFERLTLFATNETGVTTTKYNVSYSNFYFTEVDQFRMETNTISGTTAWMNENKFFGARIRESLTMTGDYPMNNNAFYGFKMEGITITLDSFNGGLGAHSNTWHDTRFEFDMTFNFGVGTFNNTFVNTWGNFSFVGFLGRNAGTWTINDLGRNNDIVTMQHTYTDGETLLELSAESRNHDWAHFERVGYKLENRKTFTQFFDTGLVPLSEPIWFVIESDNALFNYFVEVFDPDGNRIYTDLSVVEAGMTWNNTFKYYDLGGGVAAGQEISIKKTTGVGFFRLYGRTAGGTIGGIIEYWRLRSIQKKKGARELRLLPYKGGTETLHGVGVPTYGTFKRGDIIENQAPSVGSPVEWRCVQSGTFSAATDNAGDTDGSTGIITGMTDTSDFNPGDYVTVSAGFPAGDIQIISVDTANQVTVNLNSNSAQVNVTVATVDPLFGAGPNLV